MAPRFKLNSKQQSELAHRYSKGEGRKSLALDFKISVRAVSVYINRVGVTKRSKRTSALDDPTIQKQVIGLYRTYSTTRIAELIDIHASVIQRFLKKMGLSRRKGYNNITQKCAICMVACVKKYCPRHKKIVLAEQARNHRAKVNPHYKSHYSGVSVWDDVAYDRGYGEATIGEWRPKKSGYAGPTVMQLHTGTDREKKH